MWAKSKLSLHTVAKFSEDQNGDIMAVNNEGQVRHNQLWAYF